MVYALALLLFAGSAHAEIITHARYDARRDAIVVQIAYSGTTARHRFSVQWSECDPSAGDVPQVAARLVDLQGNEPEGKEYRVTRRFSVAHIKCRPAIVTLRLSRSFVSVDLPPRER